jgi:hypothetical protein
MFQSYDHLQVEIYTLEINRPVGGKWLGEADKYRQTFGYYKWMIYAC